jgi:asparagine synthase (glutamine-hydrolysing)
MCGICGIFYLDRNVHVQHASLAAMNQQLVHRGPDDDGLFVEENVGLAVRRLSIIDIKTGRQPITDENESVWIVYNGEIYNHAELRDRLEARGHRYRTKSDTETVVHLYEEYGQGCVQHLRGMFGFAIWDRRKRQLFVARDRLGIKPLYYRYDGSTFLFGSEIKAILAYPGVEREFNHCSLAEYLAFGYVAGEQTMFAGIQKLLPGHTLTLDESGKLSIEKYWDLRTRPDEASKSREYYIQTYREMLEQSVSSHLMSDVPLGVFLSGGLDSSAIAALATKIRQGPIETFSVGYDEEQFSELPAALQVAQHINSNHHEVRLSREEFFQALPQLIRHEDEPIAWPSSVAIYFVARLARERVTVVLTGEGSDETLGGYTRYAWTIKNARMDTTYRAIAPEFLRRGLRNALDALSMSAGLHRKLDHTFLKRDGESWSSFYFDNFYSAFSAAEQGELLTDSARANEGDAYAGSMMYWDGSSGDMLHRMLYTDIKTYLVELLMKQDQMSMAASIESRVPFLDHQLVEFAANIPPGLLIKGLAGKQILKDAVDDILPHAIIHRRKMGFPTPWDAWLSGPQLNQLEQMLTETRSIDRGLFRREAVKRLFDEHRAKRRDHGNRIWRLLNLELWYRVMIDGERVEPGVSMRSGALERARS